MAYSVIRPIRIEGNIAVIPLTQGYEAIIDADDAHLVEGSNWFIKREASNLYARRRSAPRDLHRLIVSAPRELQVDHIDGNGLNNRRANLRLATRSQNACNRKYFRQTASGFKGVYLHKETGKWRASICIKGAPRRSLGLFDAPEQAHAAYCAAAAELHGAFARFE